jgi:Gpi18-like mannosyltransferase
MRLAVLCFAAPGLLLNAAHWGQPDGVHATLAVAGMAWLAAGSIGWGWAALALALLAKPQAWALLPAAVMVTWHAAGRQRLSRAAMGAGAALACALFPFFAAGRIDDVLRLPGAMAAAMPVASANAHNAWWIVAAWQSSSPVVIPDTAPLVAGVSYRTAAGVLGVLVAAQALYGAWLYATGRAGSWETGALVVVGWFVFTTQAHENHVSLALPLLAVALMTRPALRSVDPRHHRVGRRRPAATGSA